jgi:adenine/guanine phosphoribosyltransferase-like PRPP-binding protein
MYSEKDLVAVGKRENNKKRNYLVVNPLQGKHIPVRPGQAFELFDALADLIRAEYKEERLLLIGFAETATAIGAEAAVRLGAQYIQTTREHIPGVSYLFFSESHSHATEQKLVKDDIDQAIGRADRVVFIEDEVTTGNTILNIVSVMEELYGNDLKFSVASLLNGMEKEHLEIYEKKGIAALYVLKTDHEKYAALAERNMAGGIYEECGSAGCVCAREVKINGKADARRLVDGAGYRRACESLWHEIDAAFKFEAGERVLVVGTEEFMYPALFAARCMEEKGVLAWSHSTTRSPVMVFADESYPLKTRYELKSLYDKDRTTYLYNIESYDRVFIITDAAGGEEEGKNSLVGAIARKNNNINLIRWC